MKQNNKLRTETIWMIFFTVLPVVLTMNYGQFISSDKGMEVLYGGLLGGVGAMVGFAIYSFSKNKTVRIKTGILTLTIILSLAPIPFLKKSTASEIVTAGYRTCDACGYIGFREVDQSCDNCGLKLTKEELEKSGLQDFSELIKLEQIYYFIPEEGDSINFYEPEVSEDGFRKDLSWKPRIIEDTIEVYARAYYEFQKKNTIEVQVIKK